MIYLAYSDDNFSSETLQSFNELLFTENKNVTRTTGRTLRQFEFSHSLSKRSTWTLIISADDLHDSGLLTYLENFWQAAAWKFSLDNWFSETEIVLANQDAFPVEFIEGIKTLPEVTFTFIEKEPN